MFWLFFSLYSALFLLTLFFICFEIRTRKSIIDKYYYQKLLLLYYIKLSNFYIGVAFFLLLLIFFCAYVLFNIT